MIVVAWEHCSRSMRNEECHIECKRLFHANRAISTVLKSDSKPSLIDNKRMERESVCV